ncbi:HAMP domain-containing histidine kinase [Patescibacteria group bacterium]|nr:HAMP domain-containing histidine kinase [Patescibacteria group bacterium]
MSLRALLISLFGVSSILIFAFIFFFNQLHVQDFIHSTPFVFSLAGQTLVVSSGALLKASSIFTFILLIFLFLFLILDRIAIRPFQMIAAAMDEFAAHNTQLPLTTLNSSMAEIRSLTHVFLRFTDSIEKVHTRDMEISRVKSDFISTAAHQLRTPLTGIRWALEALQLENLTEDQAVLVKSAVDKSHDLVAIVGTLLDISSIESGKYKYTFAPTDVALLLAEVVRDFTVLAQKNKVNLYYEAPQISLPMVRADRERIKWVLNNLIENALRYTPAEGTVKIRSEMERTIVVIRVQDTGIGISPQDRNNIFERFYRAGNAIAKENQGNGLGLYIARTIVTDHGGDLTFAANTEGPGTTFELTLPVV